MLRYLVGMTVRARIEIEANNLVNVTEISSVAARLIMKNA